MEWFWLPVESFWLLVELFSLLVELFSLLVELFSLLLASSLAEVSLSEQVVALQLAADDRTATWTWQHLSLQAAHQG